MRLEIHSLWQWGRQELMDSGIASPGLDAALLLSHVTGLSKEYILAAGGGVVDEQQAAAYGRLIHKRCGHAPAAYLLGSREFMGLDFYVDENVLIPRPDTEILVEEAIRIINEKRYVNILELCTGSGCIAVSLAKYCPSIRITATDISAAALVVAEKNAAAHSVGDRIEFVRSDLFENLRKKYDMLVSNPPYIADMAALPADVRDHEPSIALDGGAGGLLFYRRILGSAREYLNAGGDIILEIGWDQAADVVKLMEGDFIGMAVLKDLSGLDRACTGRLQ